MDESPEFKQAKAEGKTATNPLKESFGNKYNLKFVLLALFGAAMGQGVVWYTGQFYSMSFMKTVMFLESDQADLILGIALLLGTPFFVICGKLSDKVGRKWVMLTGMLLALLTYRPIYESMYQITNLSTKTETAAVIAASHTTIETSDGMNEIHTTTQSFTDGTSVKNTEITHLDKNKTPILKDGKPYITAKSVVHISGGNYAKLVFLIFIQILYITLVYGPIAAFLVELFPVQIRYTSMSLPYHIGNGIFGGLLPAVSTYLASNALSKGQADYYLSGLWYPIIISAVCFIIGAIYITKSMSVTKKRSITMEGLKRILGIVWIALALLTAYFCVFHFGLPKLSTGHQEDLVFGIIILFILTPIISIGLAVFGYFALTGEYDQKKM